MKGRHSGAMDIASTFDHEPFRHTDEKYKCLCNKMHCKQGCRFILAFLIGVIVLGLILLIVNFSTGTWSTFILHLILLGGVILSAATLFLAMKTEKEKLLLPVVGLSIFGAVLSVIFLIFSLWSLIEPSGETGRIVNNFVIDNNNTLQEDHGLQENKDEIQVISAVTTVLSLLGIAASAWVALVVYKYFMYLRDMKRARNPQTQIHHEFNEIKKGMTQ